MLPQAVVMFAAVKFVRVMHADHSLIRRAVAWPGLSVPPVPVPPPPPAALDHFLREPVGDRLAARRR